jgi:hypothetical protein
MPLTVAQCRDDLLSKLGIESAALATDLALQDVAVAMNGALQELQRAGEAFFTRESLTVTIGAGTAFYTLPQAIQSVIGPARLNDVTPLRGMNSRGELDQFARIFFNETGVGAGTGVPMAFYVDTRRQAAVAGDIVRSNLYLAPAPLAAGTLVLDVVNDAPGYDVDDLDDTTEIPVAQAYTESIFLPIARMLVTRSSTFTRPNLLPQLTEDFERAMQRLATAGGFPAGVLRTPERETKG